MPCIVASKKTFLFSKYKNVSLCILVIKLQNIYTHIDTYCTFMHNIFNEIH